MWTETPHEVHIHLAGSSQKLGLALDGMAGLGDQVARHVGRLILKPVLSCMATARVRPFPYAGTWEKLVPPPPTRPPPTTQLTLLLAGPGRHDKPRPPATAQFAPPDPLRGHLHATAGTGGSTAIPAAASAGNDSVLR